MTVQPIDARPQPGLILAGEVVDLFSHMALWGLAAICEDAGLGTARGSWTGESRPRPVLHVDADPARVALAVQAHAARRASSEAWLQARSGISGGGRPFATLAARTACPKTTDEWIKLDHEIQRVADHLPSELDGKLTSGIGYRAWWLKKGGTEPSHLGSSAWELCGRNGGMDVIKTRIAPLGQAVAAWSHNDILDGLTGIKLRDELGENKQESRSANGFRTPGPVDNALAWCAMWGLCALPVLPSVSVGGRSPAFVPKKDTAAGMQDDLLMVVPAEPIPLARFEMLQRSEHLVQVGMVDSLSLPLRTISFRWLQSRGASAILRFPVGQSRAKSPERHALSGEQVRV